MKRLVIEAADGLMLHATVYPVDQPRGLVQIIHGAKEHQGRYIPFAKFLQRKGFAVITSDNRGHGASVNDEYPLGYMNGVSQIVEDQRLITEKIKHLYPGCKLSLFGHSLGSVFARCYLQRYGEKIDRLILSGMVNYVFGVSLAIFLTKVEILRKGKDQYNRFLEKLSLKYQKDDSWISVSEDNLKNYRKDPLCQFSYQNNAVLTIFEGVRQLKNISIHSCKNPELPILSISGEGDPITGGERGLRQSIRFLEKAGYKYAKKIVYPNMKHEVLNEGEKEIVYQDVLAFLTANKE